MSTSGGSRPLKLRRSSLGTCRSLFDGLCDPGGQDEDRIRRIRDLANVVIRAIREHVADVLGPDDEIDEATELLLAIMERPRDPRPPRAPARPDTPLTSSALLVNGTDQPRVGLEVIKEMASAESVDLISAFIKWNGLRVVRGALETLLARGGRVRVITTTYIGATDRRAIDELVRMGAEVRCRTTRE